MNRSINETMTKLSLSWEEDGLYSVQREKHELVCNFLPIVETCGRDVESGEYFLNMRILIAGDAVPVMRKGMPIRELENKDWYQELDGRCFLMNYKTSHLKKLVMCQVTSMEIMPIVRKTGWGQKSGKWYFRLGDQLWEETSGVHMENKRELQDETQEKLLDAELGRKIRRLLKKGGCAVYVTFMTALYAVLRKLFEQAGIYHMYVLYIWGPSATFKTTLAQYFTVWDADMREQVILSLESTYAALESGVMGLSDCMVLLDDLAPMEQKSVNRERNDHLARIIRGTFNRLDRSKCVGNKRISSGVDAGLAITAEQLIGIESVLNRTCLLSTEKTPVTNEFLQFVRSNPYLIQNFMPIFIKWSVENREAICTLIEEKWKLYGQELMEERMIHVRIFDTYRVLRVIQDVFEVFCSSEMEKAGKKFFALLDQYHSKAYEKNIEILEEARAAKRGCTLEYKVLKAVCDILNDKDLILLKKGFEGIYGEGYEDKHYIYLISRRLWGKLIQKEGLETLTICKLSKILANHQLIERGKGKDLQVNKYGQSCYRFDKKTIEEVTDALRETEPWI